MGFTAVDVREDSLLFRLRVRYTREDGRGLRCHEGREWRGLPCALGVTDERGFGTAYGVGYGCSVA
jgi:hypothetical protein